MLDYGNLFIMRNSNSEVSRSGLQRMLKRLWLQIPSKRRMQFSLLLALTVFASACEVISIGAVIPFLGALMAPDKVFVSPYLEPFIQIFGISDASQLPLMMTVLFVAGAIVTGVVRLMLSWCGIRLAYAAGADLSYKIYQRTLHQSYSVHISRNSSEVIAAIVSKVNIVISGVITPIVTLISSILLMLAIVGVLLGIDAVATLISVAGFGIIYLIVIGATSALKVRNGVQIGLMSTKVIKTLQEGLGGIRDILLDGSQETYCAVYRNADMRLRNAQGSNQFIAIGPRFVIEALGMSLIAIISLIFSNQNDGVGSSIPIVAALALGAQRLLPVMQQAYAAWSALSGNTFVLSEALILLEQRLGPKRDYEHNYVLPFSSEIRFCRVGFRYALSEPIVLAHADIVIEKGSRVGIIGETGAGKSTFVDLLMGLLAPSDGQIRVDGTLLNDTNRRAWQRHIAHVPQFIFLTDNSVAENIAFGIPRAEIDLDRVKRAAQQAQIACDIESWPLGYNTAVGERGVRLSGGQRQRIGIARALYKNADVIVLDEATSALDSQTEEAVMLAVDNLNEELTVIVVAHRISTLKNCAKIIKLVKDGSPRVLTYDEIHK